MEITIYPGLVSGTVKAPASKSYLQRAILAAALAGGESRLQNVSWSDDALIALQAAHNLGATTRFTHDTLWIQGRARSKTTDFYCGESGLTSRLLASIAALHDQPVTLTGSGSLAGRPFDDILEVYRQTGLSFTSENGKLPIRVKGPLRGGEIKIDGSLSSQFLSGLLMALPMATADSTLTVTNLKSTPYVKMTLDLLEHFGISIEHENQTKFFIPGRQHYRPARYSVEGDWSGAAFLLVAGCIAGEVQVENLQPDSLQADNAILDLIRPFAVRKEGRYFVSGPGIMNAFRFDATHCPDLFPPLVALAVHCEGNSVIKGVSRLRHKESNRALALQEEFAKLGARITIIDDEMRISCGFVRGGVVESHNDHRIVMALAVAGLGAAGTVTINGAECVGKSYPDFFADLEVLGVKVLIN